MMEKLRPRLREIVFRGEDHLVDPILWQAAYDHLPDTDVTADSVTLALAEFRQEKADIELLRSRVESEGD